MSASKRAFLLMALVGGCTDESDPPIGGATTADDDDDDATTSDESGSGGEPACDPVGKPEMTGPITGLHASYLAGDPIDVGVPVDEDTARVAVGVYEVGSNLYLGGNAEDVAGSSTAQISLYAGVVDGEVGEFYLSVELCSTMTCTTPLVRNTYQRADRTAPLAEGEAYTQTREFVGGDGTPETCETDIPIQSFLIE